jgi:uncharacterized sodium:solute symporter family permease YidK
MKSIATLLLGLNFCMYVIVLGIGAWAMNRAIDHGFIIGEKIFPIFHIWQLAYILVCQKKQRRFR